VTNRSGNSVSLFSASTGAPLSQSPVTGGGLATPVSIAIDEDGSAWIANAGNNSLSAISSAFVPLSQAAGYTGAGLNQPAAVAINPH
jgi:streptogramin lyase